MAKKKAVAENEMEKEPVKKEPGELDTDMYFTPKSGIKLQWVIVLGVMLAVFTLLVAWPRMKSDSAATATPPAPPEAAAAASATATPPPPSTQDVLTQELNPSGTPPPQPQATAEAAEPPPPPDLNMADSAEPEATADDAPQALPPPPPPTPTARMKANPTAKATATAAKKHSLVLNAASTKVPAGLQKKNVMTFLTKKLNADQTCLPASLGKKDLVPFTAIVSVSKAGAVTGVDLKPKKVAQAKAIAACIKKKLSGNPAAFKGKAAAKIQVSLKMK
jgi:hypothetical protein